MNSLLPGFFWSGLLALLPGLFVAMTTLAQPVQVKQLEIDRAYARATVPGQPVGAVYLIIRNTGNAPDRLLSASTPVALSVSLHETRMQHSTASMHSVLALEIPPRSEIELRPGGMHLMLEGLTQALHEGEHFHMRFKFERSGEATLDIPVKPILAEPSGMENTHPDMKGMEEGGY